MNSANELQMSWIEFDLLEIGVEEGELIAVGAFDFASLVSVCQALFIGDTHTHTLKHPNPASKCRSNWDFASCAIGSALVHETDAAVAFILT